MAKEYKNLTFTDSSSGRQKMAEVIDQLASEGWELKSKETSQQNYSFVNTCCLGCIFLPLALLGKKKNSIAVVMEREIDPNRKEVEVDDNKNQTVTDFYHKPWCLFYFSASCKRAGKWCAMTPSATSFAAPSE